MTAATGPATDPRSRAIRAAWGRYVVLLSGIGLLVIVLTVAVWPWLYLSTVERLLLPGYETAIKSSAVRTWGKPWSTRPGVTYLGGELEFAAFAKFNAGWLWKVGGSQAKRNMFAWGVGFGF